jgi:hypothetical protein
MPLFNCSSSLVTLCKGSAQKVLDTARQTAWQQFGQLGYEYKLVLHRDTDNPHVHIVLNNYNKVTNKKLLIVTL